MIVGYIPGPGHTIKNARVVLKPDETLPNRYNVVEAEVLRQHPDTYEEILIKPVGTVLPADSDILSNPEIQLGTVLGLTITTGEGNLYEHADIIRLESDSETDSGDGGDILAGADDSDSVVS